MKLAVILIMCKILEKGTCWYWHHESHSVESSQREAAVWQYERSSDGIASIEALVAVETSVYRKFQDYRIAIKDSSRSEVEPTKIMRPNICPVNGRGREVALPKYPSVWRTDYEGVQYTGHLFTMLEFIFCLGSSQFYIYIYIIRDDI